MLSYAVLLCCDMHDVHFSSLISEMWSSCSALFTPNINSRFNFDRQTDLLQSESNFPHLFMYLYPIAMMLSIYKIIVDVCLSI